MLTSSALSQHESGVGV